MKALFRFIGMLVAAYAIGAVYMLKVNPEVRFARKLANEQVRHHLETKEVGRRFLFIGGSSCSFSVIPELLEKEFGLLSVNWGYNAGAGRGVHFETALQSAREGDVVVVAFEMSGWSDERDGNITPLGSQLWFGCMRPNFTGGSKLSEMGIEDEYDWTVVRPGGKHLTSLLAKLVLGRNLLRYQDEILKRGGYLEGTFKLEKIPVAPSVDDYFLSSQRKKDLMAFKEVMEARGVEVVVSLPWRLTASIVEDQQREINAKLIKQLEKICPVLADDKLGVMADPEMFSDTRWHLSPEGAEIRTRILGESLRERFGTD